MKDPLSESGMCKMNFHTWEYLHDRSHRICKNCGLCQIKGASGWMKCTLAFLQNHIQRTEGESEKKKQQKEEEESDKKKALHYLDSIKPKTCSKCQTANIGLALYCKSCGTAMTS